MSMMATSTNSTPPPTRASSVARTDRSSSVPTFAVTAKFSKLLEGELYEDELNELPDMLFSNTIQAAATAVVDAALDQALGLPVMEAIKAPEPHPSFPLMQGIGQKLQAWNDGQKSPTSDKCQMEMEFIDWAAPSKAKAIPKESARPVPKPTPQLFGRKISIPTKPAPILCGRALLGTQGAVSDTKTSIAPSASLAPAPIVPRLNHSSPMVPPTPSPLATSPTVWPQKVLPTVAAEPLQCGEPMLLPARPIAPPHNTTLSPAPLPSAPLAASPPIWPQKALPPAAAGKPLQCGEPLLLPTRPMVPPLNPTLSPGPLPASPTMWPQKALVPAAAAKPLQCGEPLLLPAPATGLQKALQPPPELLQCGEPSLLPARPAPLAASPALWPQKALPAAAELLHYGEPLLLPAPPTDLPLQYQEPVKTTKQRRYKRKDPSMTEAQADEEHRKRNKIHSKNTRLRKKAHVEALKESLNSMVDQRDQEQRAAHVEAQRKLRNREARWEVMRTFLRLRGGDTSNQALWAAILDDAATLSRPNALGTSYVSGRSAIMSDPGEADVLLTLRGDKTASSRHTAMSFDYVCDRSTMLMDGCTCIFQWKGTTVGAKALGLPSEMSLVGTFRARFNERSNKIESAVLLYDTGALRSYS